jgi:hypothetical protein
MSRTILSFVAALPLLSACATITLPADRLEGAQASVRGAQELGADRLPQARLHLQLAKDQIAEGRKMAADGDARAVLVLARGQADAELALGLAREFTTHVDAAQAEEHLTELQSRGTP